MIDQSKPCDLLTYTVDGQDPLLPRLIGALQLALGVGRTPEQRSHVAVRARFPGTDWEANWPCIDLYRIDYARSFELWRLRDLTLEEAHHIIGYCEHTASLPWWKRLYDIPCLLTFGLVQSRHRAVCSQFAARAFAAAGIHFPKEGERIVSPDSIVDYKRLYKVAVWQPKLGWTHP